jgi:hypothetical protein
MISFASGFLAFSKSKDASMKSPQKVGRPEVFSKAILVRTRPPLLAQLDKWIAKKHPSMSRPEAIRLIMEEALTKR